jgi:IMP dehydrogenase/GMP reductase
MAPVGVSPIFLREAGMMDSSITEGLTFDDVLLLPGRSSVLSTEI